MSGSRPTYLMFLSLLLTRLINAVCLLVVFLDALMWCAQCKVNKNGTRLYPYFLSGVSDAIKDSENVTTNLILLCSSLSCFVMASQIFPLGMFNH